MTSRTGGALLLVTVVLGVSIGIAMRLSSHAPGWLVVLLIMISCIVGLAQQTLP